MWSISGKDLRLDAFVVEEAALDLLAGLSSLGGFTLRRLPPVAILDFIAFFRDAEDSNCSGVMVFTGVPRVDRRLLAGAEDSEPFSLPESSPLALIGLPRFDRLGVEEFIFYSHRD